MADQPHQLQNHPTGRVDEFDADPKKSTILGELLRGLLPLLLVAGAILVFQKFGKKSPPPTKPPAGPREETVVSAEVAAYTQPIEIRVEGIVRPYRYLKLASEVAGRVRFKSEKCQEATLVQKGEVLLEIDPTDYEIAEREIANQLKQSEHALEEWEVDKANTEQQIKLAKRDLDLAKRETERLRQLEAERVATASEIDSAKKIEVASQNQLLTQENRLRMLNAVYDRTVAQRDLQTVKLERAKRDLEKTKIVAPCNATIVSEDVEQDGYVQPGATVVVLNDVERAEVQCNLELDDMYWIWGAGKKESLGSAPIDAAYQFPQTPVTVEFQLPDNQYCQWEGKLVRFSGSGLDLTTRTIPCQVSVEQPRSGKLIASGSAISLLQPPPLTVGMFVSVVAKVAPATPLLEIPNEALRPGDAVWVMQNGKLHIQAVRVARRNRDTLLVHAESGALAAGDRVIVSPLALAQEGLLVKEGDVR